MKARVRRAALPAGRRILAVSDVHGALSYLQGLLEKTGFGPEDVLVLVGDLLEKGPRSLDTLRYVMDLCRTHTVYPLLGNCDEWDKAVALRDAWREDYVRGYVTHNTFRYPGLLAQMCAEIGFGTGPDMDVRAMKAALREAFAPEFAFLAGLPHVIETGDYTFVHGGLPEGAPEDWDAWSCMKNDNFLGQGRAFDHWVVVGHWPVVLYGADRVCANPILRRDLKIASIDGGCVLKDDGQLNALVIPEAGSEDFSFMAYDPFPVGRVKTAQAGSRRSAYIRWGDNAVQVLRRGAEFSLCRHTRTGYRMEILTKYLFEENGAVRCNDCTDYVLPLAAGDEVSVVEKTEKGYLVKHRGTSGWYYGALEAVSPGERL